MTARLLRWLQTHPRWASWFALALGMVIIFWIAARDKGLTGGQMAGMTVAVVLLAGLCVRIVGWE